VTKSARPKINFSYRLGGGCEIIKEIYYIFKKANMSALRCSTRLLVDIVLEIQ
jgi:hypothetical protein